MANEPNRTSFNLSSRTRIIVLLNVLNFTVSPHMTPPCTAPLLLLILFPVLSHYYFSWAFWLALFRCVFGVPLQPAWTWTWLFWKTFFNRRPKTKCFKEHVCVDKASATSLLATISTCWMNSYRVNTMKEVSGLHNKQSHLQARFIGFICSLLHSLNCKC